MANLTFHLARWSTHVTFAAFVHSFDSMAPAPTNTNEPDEAKQTCSLCGVTYSAAAAGGQCPRCLLSLASSIEIEADALSADGLLGLLQVRQFGDYELLEEISRGGMGVVYHARQISLKREVAVKMMLIGELADEASLRMFQREARAAANLHHPNIVPVYEIGEFEMQHYFSMRFVPGGRNIAHWAADCRIDFQAIAEAMAKVAYAVAHAHERGVLHRDLKPSNILWAPEGEPLVTDFGLAKLLDETGRQSSLTSLMAGSPSYMAPEQTLGSLDEITVATDVYGLGAVLYDLLAGRPPFIGRTVLETANMVNDTSPPPLPKVPKDLRTICFKCLSKQPQDRYATATELAEELERFVRGEPIRALPLSATEKLVRWIRRKPALAALSGLVLLTFSLGLSGILWQWREAVSARRQQAETLDRLRWQQVDRWINEDETGRGLAYLAGQIRHQPENWQAAMYAMSIIEQNRFPIMLGPEVRPKEPLVTPAKLSADGSWWAGAYKNAVVRIWSVASGEPLADLKQASTITALEAGEGLYVAIADGSVKYYSQPTAEPIEMRKAGAEEVRQLQLSADGLQLMGQSSQSVSFWRTDQPAASPKILRLEGGVTGATLNAKGDTALLWNQKAAAVISVESMQELTRMEARRKFTAGALVGKGSRAALLDGNQQARCWDFSNQQIFESPFDPIIEWNRLAFDASGDRLAMAGDGMEVVIYDIAGGVIISPRMAHHYMTEELVPSNDNKTLYSYGSDDQVRMWDAYSGRSLGEPINRSRVIKRAMLDLSKQGHSLLVHDENFRDGANSVSVWSWTNRTVPQTHVAPEKMTISLSRLSPNGKMGCLGLIDLENGRHAYFYDIETGKALLQAECKGPVYVQLLSPDHQRAYALTANGWLHGWDLKTGKELWPAGQQPGKIRPATLSSDGRLILAGHNDGYIRVYDTASGKMVKALRHPGEVKVLHFQPGSNTRFLSASTDTEAHIWDLQSGEKVRSFQGHDHTIISAAWSPDGEQIVTASYDYTVRLWDTATGRMIGAPMRHLAWLSHVTFSPDGTRIASACRDGTARLWFADSGLPASPPLQQGSTAETVKFTADSQCLMVRDMYGFRYWSSDKGEPITLHYQEPTPHSVGMDSESYRAIMNEDGTRVFLGYSMKHAAYWSIPQPRQPAPPWFADFLESLAMISVDIDGTATQVPQRSVSELIEQIETSPANDPYAVWARQVLGR